MSATGAGGRGAAGGPGGIPGLPPQAQDLMGTLMPYVPQLLSFASKIPAYIAGYLFTLVVLLLFVGRAELKFVYYPTAAYDIISIAVASVLIKHLSSSHAYYTQGYWQQRKQEQFTKDIHMKYELAKKDQLD